MPNLLFLSFVCKEFVICIMYIIVFLNMWCSCCCRDTECNSCDPVPWIKSSMEGFKVMHKIEYQFVMFSVLWNVFDVMYYSGLFMFLCSSFEDIFDVDHFIDILKDDGTIVKELYEEYNALSVRDTRIKVAPVHATTNWYLFFLSYQGWWLDILIHNCNWSCILL